MNIDAIDLDKQIERAEHAVITRDQRVARQGRELVTRVERGVRRNFGRGLLAGAATLALAWFVPSRRHAASAPASANSAMSTVPWAALIPIVWPLLPPTWRRRVSPGTATMVVGVALPLLSALRPPLPPVQTAPHVDWARFAGRWYELARLPRDHCASDATLTYTAHADTITVDECCRTQDGRDRRTQGVACVAEGSGGAKLELSVWPAALRWLPLTWSGHWVIHVDDEYQCAVVGTPDRKSLRLLARAPAVDDATYELLIGHATAQGFAVDRLRRVAHNA